jgi:dienelactone hydrolase
MDRLIKNTRNVLIIIVLLHSFLFAGEEFVFQNGLVLPQCHSYGRVAFYQDKLADQLYGSTLQTPQAGQSIGADENGDDLIWQPIETGDDSTFKDRAMASGYLYLTYDSPVEKIMILNITGNSMVFVNGAPRAGDIYAHGYVYLPVKLKKGLNEFYVQTSRYAAWYGVKARLMPVEKEIQLLESDLTLPYIILDETDQIPAAVRILNSTDNELKNLSVSCEVNGKITTLPVPNITALTSRKVRFDIDPSAVTDGDFVDATLSLFNKSRKIDELTIPITVTERHKKHSRTFISKIDNSVQYFSVQPQVQGSTENPALFLSVHGAAVHAMNQAQTYDQKDWGVVVAPTNRRPRGFNWEDWGRIDALEVLDLAKVIYNTDPKRTYLTGHSMGGHGTWYLGVTYPGLFAAIAPCAGYPTLFEYGSHDGIISDPEKASDMEKMLLRASNGSNPVAMRENYLNHGIYVLHGDADQVVPVDLARGMRKELGEFHPDFCYYEYPGGSHWYGDESMDWFPIFDYFKWHTLKSNRQKTVINFTTVNPAISSELAWAKIEAQDNYLEYTTINLEQDTTKKSITGSTNNVTDLSFDLDHFNVGDTLKIELDENPALTFIIQNPSQRLYLAKHGEWRFSTPVAKELKGAHRNGAFKEAFDNSMIFVYGTSGTKAENAWAYNKARFDAESWHYRANGAVDLVADKKFDAKNYPDRGIILYGNADTNSAWKKLLASCPITVTRNKIELGSTVLSGDDLGAYFIYPRQDSDAAGIAVISGTGLQGMNNANANQYFAGGSGFFDFMIFDSDMLKHGVSGVKMAGFFDKNWSLDNADFITNE